MQRCWEQPGKTPNHNVVVGVDVFTTDDGANIQAQCGSRGAVCIKEGAHGRGLGCQEEGRFESKSSGPQFPPPWQQ